MLANKNYKSFVWDCCCAASPHNSNLIRSKQMIRSIIIIIAIGGTSFYYTDIQSTSKVYSALFPFVDFLALVALAFWFVALFHRHSINQTTNSSDVGTSGFSDFDGGSGGGDGC